MRSFLLKNIVQTKQYGNTIQITKYFQAERESEQSNIPLHHNITLIEALE